MIDPRTLLNTIIRPTLRFIGLDNSQAEMLVLGTGLTESGLNAIVQNNGPALGFWQMEPATAKDIWLNFLRFRTDLRMKVNSLIGTWPDPYDQAVEGNLYYAAAMCRIKYLRVPDALPIMELDPMAEFWKKWYNTPLGAGTPDDFKKHAAVIIDPAIWR